MCVLLLVERILSIYTTCNPIKITNQIVNTNIYIKSNELCQYISIIYK